jgi:hypothetical protein
MEDIIDNIAINLSNYDILVLYSTCSSIRNKLHHKSTLVPIYAKSRIPCIFEISFQGYMDYLRCLRLLKDIMKKKLIKVVMSYPTLLKIISSGEYPRLSACNFMIDEDEPRKSTYCLKIKYRINMMWLSIHDDNNKIIIILRLDEHLPLVYCLLRHTVL